MADKPKNLVEEHLEYLDDLRDSGVINMFGARPHLESAFPELETKEAGTIVRYWMTTFGARHKEDE